MITTVTERSLQPYYPELARIGAESRLSAGDVLWKEGDPGDSVVMLLEGVLEVLHEGPDGTEVLLRALDSGTVVGELASTDGQARSATVRARTACRILRVPAADFRNLLKRRPDILEQLYFQQVERVRSLTKQVSREHRQAITDPLTRLYNVVFFRERLDMELERAAETGDLVSVVMFDIDHFKHFNDTHGHEEGNEVLTIVGALLRAAGRRGEIVARYGGEEFVTLLYGATREEAARFADTVRQKVQAYEFAGGNGQPGGRVTMSAGVATFPWDAQTHETLIKAADDNLYRAKQSGRNRVVAEEPVRGGK
jgi:diguanylate cyclase (GGDEF)-like protein